MKALRVVLTAVSLTTAIVFVYPPLARGQAVGTIASSVGTALVLDTLFKGLNDTIQSAQDAADYTTAMAAARAKDVLEEWRRVNSGLLSKTFGELDKASQENFGRTNKLIADFNDPLKDRLATAQQMVNVTNQIAQSLPIPGGKQVYVSEYKPRVAPPNERTSFIVRLTGVNLDKGDLQMKLGGRALERTLTGPLEASFTIPVNTLPVDRSKLAVLRLDLSYSTPKEGLWAWLTSGRETVNRQLSIGVLPTSIGTFKLTGDAEATVRESEPYTGHTITFKGRDTEKKAGAVPKPGGWLWDLSKPFNVEQLRGEAASCQGPFLNEASPHAVPIGAKLKAIVDSRYPLQRKSAWQECRLTGTVYRDVIKTGPIPGQEGSVSWTDDVALKLPTNLKAWTITVRTFDGRSRTFNTTGADKFFSVSKSADAIILNPIVPSDIQ